MSYVYYASILQEIKFIHRRKGGSNKSRHHSEWCQTVQFEPDVISMSFIPITSLLSGINGSGFLTHAINLYTRCKCEFFFYWFIHCILWSQRMLLDGVSDEVSFVMAAKCNRQYIFYCILELVYVFLHIVLTAKVYSCSQMK